MPTVSESYTPPIADETGNENATQLSEGKKTSRLLARQRTKLLFKMPDGVGERKSRNRLLIGFDLLTVEYTEMKISAVIPVYNEIDTIEELIARLRAVLSQLDHDFEILVVDDGSTDGTAQRLEDLRSPFRN